MICGSCSNEFARRQAAHFKNETRYGTTILPLQLMALPLVSLTSLGQATATTARKPLNIMLKSAWGSDDPTKAAFPFLHGPGAVGGRALGSDFPAG